MTEKKPPHLIERYAEQLVNSARQVTSGFLPLQKEAGCFVQEHGLTDCLAVANALLGSEVYQARSLATFMLGYIAAQSEEALVVLQKRVALDEDWRVQEILAKAFDRYCADTGYEKALPDIRAWLRHEVPNVRRAVTEGLRIWTGRPYFKEHPDEAVEMLSRLRDDESEYVRRSVGNALKDISKKHRELVKAETQRWDLGDKKIQYTYRYASKYLKRSNDKVAE
jgi:3-methyladenine DNA glycosylase AlkC